MASDQTKDPRRCSAHPNRIKRLRRTRDNEMWDTDRFKCDQCRIVWEIDGVVKRAWDIIDQQKRGRDGESD